MRKFSSLNCFYFFLSALIFLARPASSASLTLEQNLKLSTAVFRGGVVSLNSYVSTVDGRIHTRAQVRVDEVFKGNPPATIELDHPGGEVGGKGEMNDFAPRFKVGDERIFFVSRRPDGTWYATRGHVSALKLTAGGGGNTALNELRAKIKSVVINSAPTVSANSLAEPQDTAPFSSATNLITGPDTIGPRFLALDQGLPIHYLIDADHFPANMTQAQAVGAAQSAIAAWSKVGSVRFQFDGVQSFGMAANQVPGSDRVLRIQLHDFYNSTGAGSGDGVAVGGQGYNVSSVSTGWTGGGNVRGNDFYEINSASVIVQSTNEVFESVSTLAECVAHEVGHALGLGHSSDDINETNAELREAVMYFVLHADGCGAQLNSFDTNAMLQIYPSNTPPFTYSRIIDCVTTPDSAVIPGVNMVQVPGFDLQTPTNQLVFQVGGDSQINGSFSNVGNTIVYTPNGFFGDTPRLDPGGSGFYDVVYARYSDGTNASPFAGIAVISYNADSFSEGIPDTWRNNFFGSTDPGAGPNRHANDDFDGDGYSNLQEYLLGSDPTDPNSNLRITSFSTTNIQWQAANFQLYELFSSTNLTNWSLAVNPIMATNSVGTATGFTNGGPKQFFRIGKVP